MKAANRLFRVAETICATIYDIALAIFCWLLLMIILFLCKVDVAYNMFLSYGIYVYSVLAFLVILRNVFHRTKWYVRNNPTKIKCIQCQAIVTLTRYDEEQYLMSPISFCIPRITQIFKFVGYQVLFYKTAYRPYLQLDCPECGEKQVICPYCHQPISQESVMCLYDKPSTCPHCGKKIYTPVPIREWKDSLYIGDILK